MRYTTIFLSATLALGALAGTPDARACGGTFCSQTQVAQNAERVLFVRHGREVTAVIQVQVQGSDPNFAWVVPVDSVPRNIHEEPSSTFTTLERATAPTYLFANGGRFSPRSSGGLGCGAMEAAPSLGGSDRASSSDAVRTWASGETSNFHYDVVSSNDPAALLSWLNANRYVTPPEAEPIIAGYVAQRKFFVAFRLHGIAGVPSFLVSPVSLTYTGEKPCVPIRLTRIATAPTLPILTYVLADMRAIPMNYSQTQVSNAEVARLGPVRFRGATAYDTLVTAAVREAGGRAWITEFAGPLPDGVRESFSPGLAALLPDSPYVTRMYTTLAASDMDRDPEFVFARALPDVSNIHDLSSYGTSSHLVDLRFLLAASTLVGTARALRRRLRRRAT